MKTNLSPDRIHHQAINSINPGRNYSLDVFPIKARSADYVCSRIGPVNLPSLSVDVDSRSVDKKIDGQRHIDAVVGIKRNKSDVYAMRKDDKGVWNFPALLFI